MLPRPRVAIVGVSHAIWQPRARPEHKSSRHAKDLSTRVSSTTRCRSGRYWDFWLRIAQRHGQFIGMRKRTYVIDTTHDSLRISHKPESVVRHAAQLFTLKHHASSPIQRIRVLAVLVDYPQVRLGFLELTGLLAFGRGKAVGKYLLRRTFGADRFDSVHRRLPDWSHFLTKIRLSGMRQ